MNPKNEPKMNPNEPKMNPNEPKMNPNEPTPKGENQPHQRSETKEYNCIYCCNKYSTNSHMRRHEKKCKVKIENTTNEQQFQIMKGQMKELKDKNLTLTNNVNNLTNNIQNLTKINTQNNGTINYLNIHFNNVLSIELFLENLKNKFPLSNIDRKCLLETYNECGIEAFADTFSCIMKKNLKEQIRHDFLPTIPIVCTDSNLRSIKEYHEDGWKATQSNSSIDQMIDISNEQIYESEKTKMFISHKERKKVYSKMKKDNTMQAMEELKKKYENLNVIDDDNSNITQDTEDSPIIEEETKDEPNPIDKNFDFINDELLEKYACDKLPQVI